jgi:hypothetical protein
VQPAAVVENLDVVRDGERSPGPGRERVAVVRLVLQGATKLSAAALSQHTPVRPTLRCTLLSLQNWANSAEVYWVPAVEVEDRDGIDVTTVDRHRQCVDDQRGPHVRRKLPAHDHPCYQVDYVARYIQPSPVLR